MKVPTSIRNKMHRIAKLAAELKRLSAEVDSWLEAAGCDIDSLRCGDGTGREELDYGNDVTDDLCRRIEATIKIKTKEE